LVVQLASLKTRAATLGEWPRLREAHSDLLADFKPMVAATHHENTGTPFRVQIGPFPRLESARSICREFKARNVSCLVARRRSRE
ncbi:MAG: SPOR domain-containing protein, partial [Gammaproteobacteria bacterium]